MYREFASETSDLVWPLQDLFIDPCFVNVVLDFNFFHCRAPCVPVVALMPAVNQPLVDVSSPMADMTATNTIGLAFNFFTHTDQGELVKMDQVELVQLHFLDYVSVLLSPFQFRDIFQIHTFKRFCPAQSISTSYWFPNTFRPRTLYTS